MWWLYVFFRSNYLLYIKKIYLGFIEENMDIIMIKKEKVERKYFSIFKWRLLGVF